MKNDFKPVVDHRFNLRADCAQAVNTLVPGESINEKYTMGKKLRR